MVINMYKINYFYDEHALYVTGGKDYKENMKVMEWVLNKKLGFIDVYAHELAYYKSFVNTKTGDVKVIFR